jgi:hypothetical protein
MYAETVKRIEHFHSVQDQTKRPDSLIIAAAHPSSRRYRLNWLQVGIDAIVRYVIRQQMAAAMREVRRGRDRLWVRPDRD